MFLACADGSSRPCALPTAYGDPRLWTPRTRIVHAIDVCELQQYPPSLLYVLMTLGRRWSLGGPGPRARAHRRRVRHFRRVPLFYYLLHVPLIHVLAIACALIQFGEAGFLFSTRLSRKPMAG